MLEYRFNPDSPYINLNVKTYYNENHFASTPLSDAGGFGVPQDVHVNTTGVKLSNKSVIATHHIFYDGEYSFYQWL